MLGACRGINLLRHSKTPGQISGIAEEKRVQQDRFYVVMDEQLPPQTLAELEQVLLVKKDKDRVDPIQGIEIVIYQDSVDKDHPAVRELQKWAQMNGLRVTISFPPGNRS